MSEERTNMAIRDLKHYVIDNMSLDVQDDFEIICKYITSLQQKVEQLEKENEKLKYLVDDSHTMKAFIVEHNKVEQLENIRKEAIEFMKENCDIITIDKGWIIRSELTTTGLGKLFKNRYMGQTSRM